MSQGIMGRSATGYLRENRSHVSGKPASWGMQFWFAGRRRYLTLPAKSRDQALREMALIIRAVRQGTWAPPKSRRSVRGVGSGPSFEQFAGSWVARQKVEGGRHRRGLSRSGQADLQWRIEYLLAHFSGLPIDQITVSDVDGFRLARVQEGRLGATSINKMLATLAAILETAVEYDLIDRNPAKGSKRKLPAVKPRRSCLDRAEHISALLDAARELDLAGRAPVGQRRALIATLIFAGLRIGELQSLRWGDVDLLRGTIRVRQAKTEAGVRIVHMLPILRREFGRHRDQIHATSNQLVFATASGRPLGSSNIRIRMLARAVRLASAQLESRGQPPLPEGITPHALRRTFASLLFALGEPPPYVMSQIGHTTAALTLALYAREMSRRDGEHERLKALVSGALPQVASRACSSTTTSVVARITPRYGTPIGIVKAEAALTVAQLE